MRLLLVEDEEKLARLVKRALVAERFSVDVAHDGKSGLELATTYDYDLIVLDLLLPEMDGSTVGGSFRSISFAQSDGFTKSVLRRRQYPGVDMTTARSFQYFVWFLSLAGLPQSKVLAQTIELVPVAAKSVSRKLELPGEFQPFMSVALHARVAGYVEKVNVDRGSVVKEGELLAELSAPELKAQIVEAGSRVQVSEAERLQAQAKLASLEATLASLQSTLTSAQSNYDRLKSASQTPGAISGNELDIALRGVEAQRSNIDAQRAGIEAQRASIEVLRNQTMTAEAAVRVLREMETYLRVTAPFDGVITERLVHPGAVVGPGTSATLVTLEQVTHLRLIVAVPEANVGGITKGASVEFKVPAYTERTFTGTIARLSQSLDEKTRTMPVEVDVNNKDGMLAPGMYANVKWPVRSAGAGLYVPKTAVVTTTERVFVIREKNGHAEWVDVKKGAADGDLILVTGQLQPGDRVVKRATDELRDGALLKPSTTPATPAK